MARMAVVSFDDAPSAVPESPRTRPWWVLGVIVGIGGLLLGAQWVLDAREDAAVAALAGVPGVVPQLDGRIVVQHELTDDGMFALWQAANGEPAAPDLQVADDGSQSVRSLDPATGEERWSVRLLGPDPARADAGVDAGRSSSCQSSADDARQVVCLVTDGFVRYQDGRTAAIRPATTTDLVVLDAEDGRVVSRRPVPSGDQLAVLPGLAVVGEIEPGRGFLLTAYDLATGTRSWTHEDPFVRPAVTAETGSFWTLVQGADVVAYDNGGDLRFVAADGTLVRRGASPTDYLQTDPRTGALLLLSYGPDGSTTTTLLAPGAAAAGDWALDGYLLTPSVDDGSVPRLVLSVSSGGILHAWDAATREERWTEDLPTANGALVVRGSVYLITQSGIVALDGRTGATRWTAEAPPRNAPVSVFTDGRHVLASFQPTAAGLGSDVVAYAFSSGAEVWRAPLPDGVVSAMAVGSALVGYGQDGLAGVVLGSP